MATKVLSWTPGIGALTQQARRRIKGSSTWDTTGFSPGNPLGPLVSSVSTVIPDNTVYQFQIASNCTNGGPATTPFQEAIVFVCVSSPVLSVTDTTATVSISGLPTDINLVKITIGSSTQTIPVFSGAASATFSSLTASTSYTASVKYGALVGGAQVYDTANTCSQGFVTDPTPVCPIPTNLTVT